MRTKPLLWLAIFLLIGLGCSPLSLLTSANPTPTVAPASTQTPQVAKIPTIQPTQTPVDRTVKVDALFVTGRAPYSGGMSSVTVRIRPANPPGELRVGMFEEEVGGTGSQWRATGWEAVMIASMLTGIDPTDYEFSFSVGGMIDGPSAGTLMTVGVLAALRGDTPRPEATMTGTINPDGSVGPVGGIPHKIDGAAKKGKKLVLVPIGQRFNRDMNQNKDVDVIEFGKSLGVEVREVGNVYDAYEQIVGKALPRPPASTATPQFPARADARLKALTAGWYDEYVKERASFGRLSPASQRWLADFVQGADKDVNQAISYQSRGLVGLAYFEMSGAATKIHKANVDGTLYDHYSAKGLNAAMEYLESVLSVRDELDRAVNDLLDLSPQTVSDVVALFDAFSELGAAEGEMQTASNKFTWLGKNAASMKNDDILDELIGISEDLVAARDYVRMGREAVDFEMGLGSSPAPQPEKIQRVAEALRRTGDANMALVESVVISPYASRLGISTDAMRGNLLQKDYNFRVAYMSQYGLSLLTTRLGTGPKTAVVVFGNAQNVYAFSSAVLAKYYSLGAQVDKDDRITGYANEKALVEMVDLADQRVKDLIALCGDDVPVSAILYYENGRALRSGTPDDQLTALNYYWQASALAQAEAFMAGKLTGK